MLKASPESSLQVHAVCQLLLNLLLSVHFKFLLSKPPEGILDQDRRVEFANRDFVFN